MIFKPLTQENAKDWKTWVKLNIKDTSEISVIIPHYLHELGLAETLKFISEFNDDFYKSALEACRNYVVTCQFDISLFDNVNDYKIPQFLECDVFNIAPDVLYERCIAIGKLSRGCAIRYYMRSPVHAKRIMDHPILRDNPIIQTLTASSEDLVTYTANELLKNTLSAKEYSSKLFEFAKIKSNLEILVKLFNKEHIEIFQKNQKNYDHIDDNLQYVLKKLFEKNKDLIPEYYQGLPDKVSMSSLIVRHPTAIPVLQRISCNSLKNIISATEIFKEDILNLHNLTSMAQGNGISQRFYASTKEVYDFIDMIAPQVPNYPFSNFKEKLFRMDFLIFIAHMDDEAFWGQASLLENTNKIQEFKTFIEMNKPKIQDFTKEVMIKVGKKRMSNIKGKTSYADMTQPLLSFFDSFKSDKNYRFYKYNILSMVQDNTTRGYDDYLRLMHNINMEYSMSETMEL